MGDCILLRDNDPSNNCARSLFNRSASFPLICITLRENIRHLASRVVESSPATDASAPRGLYGFLQVNTYALVALLPPLVVAFFTEDVSMLVGFTGTYAGLGIQVRGRSVRGSLQFRSGTHLQPRDVPVCFVPISGLSRRVSSTVCAIVWQWNGSNNIRLK